MRLFIYFLFSFLFLFETAAFAQQKYFATSNRGGAAGAKQNAQITSLQQQDDAMFNCTQAGMLYAPGHAQADGNGCLSALTTDAAGDTTFSNNVKITGNTTATGTTTLNGATTINNTLDVTGTTTLSTLNAMQINVNGNNFSAVPTCNASTQKLRWNGTGWE